MPPTIDEGGTVFANSTGNKYGAVCLGSNRTAEEPVPTTCPFVSVEFERGCPLEYDIDYFEYNVSGGICEGGTKDQNISSNL